MKLKAVSGTMLTMLVIGALTSAFNLAIAEVGGTVGGSELSSSSSSGPPSLIWSKTYGGDDEDLAYCVRQTSDGGYVLAGVTYSFGAGDADVWLVKTDASGNAEWNRTYGGAEQERGHCVQQTSDGGYIISGCVNKDPSKPFQTLFWLVKTDSNGNMKWNRTYGHGSVHVTWPSYVQQTSDGGYVLIGHSFPLTKTNTNGTIEWYKDVRGGLGAREYYAQYVQQTGDGGYIIVGYVIITTSSGDKSSYWLVKTDASGNVEWKKTYGRFNGAYARSGQQTSDGGYMLAGEIVPTGQFRSDYWLVKTDSNGNMEWNGTYGGDWSEDFGSGKQTSDDGYILAGWKQNPPTGRVWLVKTDVDGNMEWNATYGGGDWFATSVQQTGDGGYIVAGSTAYYGYQDDDFFLMKLGIRHDVAITDVQPSSKVVAQNQSLSINVTVENQGDSTEIFNVTAYASTTAIDTITGVTLTWGNSAILTFTWNTTGFIEGVYTISATVTPVPEEIDTADNTYLDGLIIVGAGPPGNLIWVNPPLIDNLQWGDIFVVDLMINITDPDGPGNATGLFFFDYKLAWEPTKIDVVDITYHNPWCPTYSLVGKNETGVLPDGRHYHWLVIGATWQSAPFTGTTSLCTYTFYVNHQSYYPDPDYNGGLDIYDDMVCDDTVTLIAHTTYDGQYRIPSKVPVHDVAVTGIAPSKTIVGQGLCMPINVTVANQGNIPESFNITAYCNTTSLGTQTVIELAPGTNTTLTFTWNTTGVPYGNYTISAYSDPVQGETYTIDNTYTGWVVVSIPGDVDGSFEVNFEDLFNLADAYGSFPNDNNWDANCDFNGDNEVNHEDLFILADHYGMFV
jgi:hypothetical protein